MQRAVFIEHRHDQEVAKPDTNAVGGNFFASQILVFDGRSCIRPKPCRFLLRSRLIAPLYFVPQPPRRCGLFL
jgi:hypothetical protein